LMVYGSPWLITPCWRWIMANRSSAKQEIDTYSSRDGKEERLEMRYLASPVSEVSPSWW
jgi:hypothetical protein